MPFFDRFWGLRVVIAAAVGVYVVLIPIRLIPQVLLFDNSTGDSSQGDMLALIAATTLLAVITLYIVWSVGRARRRVQRRFDLMCVPKDSPHDNDQPSASRLPPHKRRPFVVIWRLWPVERIVMISVGLLLFIPTLLLGLAAIGAVTTMIVNATYGQQQHLTPHGPTSFVWIAIICSLAPLWYYPSFKDAIRRSPRISIDIDGITEQSRWGKVHQVRWEDARLFEITPFLKAELRFSSIYHRYILYSQNDAVHWTDEDIRDGDTYTKQKQLPDLVKHYTGLRPIALKRSVWDI